MLLEDHERTFALYVSHETGYTDFRGYAYEHMYVVRHELAFDDLYSFVLAQQPDDFCYAGLVLIVNYFPSILWGKDDMVLTHPSCVR